MGSVPASSSHRVFVLTSSHVGDLHPRCCCWAWAQFPLHHHAGLWAHVIVIAHVWVDIV